MTDIADYDKFDYDYSTYWRNRSYEDSAERAVLNRIFRGKKGTWFLDIGGSYGRLASTYYNEYENPIIIDYSFKTLERNYPIIKTKFPKLEVVAANAYKLPFRENVFDGALMVRVLHHIEKPEIYFKEISRVMSKKATYVQEFANKIHIKAVLKSLLKLRFDIFSKDPYQQPRINTGEGSREDQKSIFLNYHPQYIQDLLKSNCFSIRNKYGCSFLRSIILKKIFSTSTLLFFEKIFQYTISWTNVSPSIFLETESLKACEKEHFSNLEDILVCPECKGSLIFEGGSARCKDCKKSYERINNIWDFRIE